MKFHSFNDQRTQRGIISFGSFFYFIGKRVPYSVIFRLRINYNSRLRNLQTGTADSLEMIVSLLMKNYTEQLLVME